MHEERTEKAENKTRAICYDYQDYNDNYRCHTFKNCKVLKIPKQSFEEKDNIFDKFTQMHVEFFFLIKCEV